MLLLHHNVNNTPDAKNVLKLKLDLQVEFFEEVEIMKKREKE